MPAPETEGAAYPHRQPSLIGALADTRFTLLATPLIVRWIYLGCATIIAMTTVFFFILALWVTTLRNGWVYGFMGMAAAPIIGFVWLLITRVACEFVLTRFRR
ncbi:DUF4282 domain-containing protein [Actinomadura hibisca]|uniref:DUF4282 domain-containing protein n=1 Tax=Actinomadura hibisca TaxID=68565 RepID=UPI0012F974A4|nr:DUF4282 domain-containing protein [Actinomadura hibisca]